MNNKLNNVPLFADLSGFDYPLLQISPSSLPFDDIPELNSTHLINSDKIYHLHTSSASAHINDTIDEENTQNLSNIYCKTLSSAIQHIKKYSQGINTQWTICLQNNNNETSFIFNQQISNLNLKFVGSNTDKTKLFGIPIFNNCIIQFQDVQFGTSGQYDISTGLDTVVFNKSTVKLNNTIFNSPSNNKSSVTLKIDKNSYCQCINENTFYAPKTFTNIDGTSNVSAETSIGSAIGVDCNSTFIGLSGSTLNLYNTVTNTRRGIWSMRGAQVIIYSDAINIKGTSSECQFDVGLFAMYAGQIYIKEQTELSGITAITKFDPLPGNLRSDGAYIRLLYEYAKENEISAFNNLYVGPNRQIKTLNKAFDIIKNSTIKKHWDIYLDAGTDAKANIYELSGNKNDSYNGIDVTISGNASGQPGRTIIQGIFRYYNSSVKFYNLTIGKPNGDLNTGSTYANIHALENTSIWLNNCICNWGTDAYNYYFLRLRMHSIGFINNCTFNTPPSTIILRSSGAKRFYNIKATLMSCVTIQSSTFNGEKTGNTDTLSATVALFAMNNSVINLGDSMYESGDTIKISGYDYGCKATYGGVIDLNAAVITNCTSSYIVGNEGYIAE